MRTLVVMLALVMLAGCASRAPETPRDVCDQQIDDDPVVKAATAKAADPDWLWQNESKLQIIRQQARARCLQGRGLGVRGGVERPR